MWKWLLSGSSLGALPLESFGSLGFMAELLLCESCPSGFGMRWALNHSVILPFHDPPGEEDLCSSPGEGIGGAEFGGHQTQVRMSSSCLQSEQKGAALFPKNAGYTHIPDPRECCPGPALFLKTAQAINFHLDLCLRNTTEGNAQRNELYHGIPAGCNPSPTEKPGLLRAFCPGLIAPCFAFLL